MGIFGTSFSIGRSALTAYQSALAVTGQNIANVGNADYTRQSGHLSTMHGGQTPGGVAPGLGVNMDQLRRHYDAAIENRMRIAAGQRNTAEVMHQTLNRVESLYGELTEYDLSTQLNSLFESFSALQTDPTELTARDQVVASADAVVKTLQRHRNGLITENRDLNLTAESMAREANEISEEIAKLNELIVAATAQGRGGDSALRDRRDALLRDLAELMDIQVREQTNGMTNVYVGSEPLVEFTRSRGIQVERVIEDGLEHVDVRFADNNGTVVMQEGRLAAVVQTRDVHLAEQLAQLDTLAAALIYEVNRVHTSGWGLKASQQVTGQHSASNANVALNSTGAGLVFPVSNGTFSVHVRDQRSGQMTSEVIEVDLDGIIDAAIPGDSDTTLASLAAALNGVTGLTASVTADNRLQLATAAGYEVSFTDDSSGVLAALGMGVFFDGKDASDIAVNASIRNDVNYIAASLNGAAGDGSNAGRLAQIGETASELLGGASVLTYHEAMVNGLAVKTAAAQTTYEATDAVYASLLAQRESISGVNLDEEAINLTLYERSYQGAARYLSVLDTLSDTVLNMVS